MSEHETHQDEPKKHKLPLFIKNDLLYGQHFFRTFGFEPTPKDLFNFLTYAMINDQQQEDEALRVYGNCQILWSDTDYVVVEPGSNDLVNILHIIDGKPLVQYDLSFLQSEEYEANGEETWHDGLIMDFLDEGFSKDEVKGYFEDVIKIELTAGSLRNTLADRRAIGRWFMAPAGYLPELRKGNFFRATAYFAASGEHKAGEDEDDLDLVELVAKNPTAMRRWNLINLTLVLLTFIMIMSLSLVGAAFFAGAYLVFWLSMAGGVMSYSDFRAASGVKAGLRPYWMLIVMPPLIVIAAMWTVNGYMAGFPLLMAYGAMLTQNGGIDELVWSWLTNKRGSDREGD